MVKYWPEKGKKGFIVWRYLFRRDDPSAAPWTEEGKQRMVEQGLSLVYPAGYLELKAQQEKERKRKSGEEGEDDEAEEENEEEAISASAKKKAKTIFSISAGWKEKFKEDEQNVKIWSEVEAKEVANKKELTDFIEQQFECIICQVGSEWLNFIFGKYELIIRTLSSCRPPHLVAITSARAVWREVFSQVCFPPNYRSGLYFHSDAGRKDCPSCRAELDEDYKKFQNKDLRSALQLIFPGYETGR